MSNVINFPKERKKLPVESLPETQEQAQETLDKVREEYILNLSTFIADIVDAQLSASGFPLPDEDDDGDEEYEMEQSGDEYWIFLVDVIAAMASRRKGVYHPLHDMIMDYVSKPLDEDEEEPNKGKPARPAVSSDTEIKQNDTD